MTDSKEIIKIGQLEIKFLLESSDTNGQMTMFEFLVPAGAKVPLPHYHEHFDEIAYGIEGIMTFTVDGKTVELKQGESLFIPRGIAHGFNNLRQQTAKALAVATPGLIGPEFFKDIAKIVNTGGPPDIEKMKLVFKKHGLVPTINK
ncbi:MAG: cupin domain-containing protein [Flavobacterium sp.]|nr:cupin domain-containing protein [Flavobacterium sp.]